MTCEVFRDSLDRMADSRKSINKDDLSPEMRSHLLGCTSCTEYLDSITIVEQILASTSSDRIPGELHDKLINLADERRLKTELTSIKPLILYILYILKILLPALSIWTIALFIPYPARILVEIALMILGLILALEKLGRRLVTYRV